MSHISNCLPPIKGFSTTAIHVGQAPDEQTGAITIPITTSSTFAQPSPGVHRQGFEYSRSDNPTRRAYEECLAALEGAKYAITFASGSAGTTTILAMLKPGDHVISMDGVYGGTHRMFNRISNPASGVTYSFVDLTKLDALEKSFTPQTKLVWIESPTNPMLVVIDIAAVAKIVHEHNCILVVDNTFLSPYFQRPLNFGADLVLHSVSKYISGHNDVISGAVMLNNDDLYKKLRFLQNGLGAIPSPFDCYLSLRGLKTLKIRMEQHGRNAMAVAKFLEGHAKVEKVVYPGLPSHPQHEIAKKQQMGYGGMITFFLKGGIEESRHFLENLKIFVTAESLGGPESLAEHPAIMTHNSIPPAERIKIGIMDNLCRLSVGLEEEEDILQDLKNALHAIP